MSEADPMEAGVVIIDDHPLVAQAAEILLRRKGLRIAGTAHDGEAGLRLILARRPAVAVVDLDLPPHGGRRLVEDVVRDAPEVGIVIYTGLDSRRPLLDVLDAGALGLVSKRSPLERLVEAVCAAAVGGHYVDPDFAPVLGPVPEGGATLSPRERAVVTLLAQGSSIADIAEALSVSPETARTHVRNARIKLEARNSPHAVAVALRRGEIEG